MKKDKKLSQKQYEVKVKELNKKPQRNPFSDIAHGRKSGAFTPEEEKRIQNKKRQELDDILNDIIDNTFDWPEDDHEAMADFDINWTEDGWDVWMEPIEYNDLMKEFVDKDDNEEDKNS
jgi:hypothetical protein